jgi:hypothetical protein
MEGHLDGKIVGGLFVAFLAMALGAGIYQGEISPGWLVLLFGGLLGFVAGRATA